MSNLISPFSPSYSATTSAGNRSVEHSPQTNTTTINGNGNTVNNTNNIDQSVTNIDNRTINNITINQGESTQAGKGKGKGQTKGCGSCKGGRPNQGPKGNQDKSPQGQMMQLLSMMLNLMQQLSQGGGCGGGSHAVNNQMGSFRSGGFGF